MTTRHMGTLRLLLAALVLSGCFEDFDVTGPLRCVMEGCGEASTTGDYYTGVITVEGFVAGPGVEPADSVRVELRAPPSKEVVAYTDTLGMYKVALFAVASVNGVCRDASLTFSKSGFVTRTYSSIPCGTSTINHQMDLDSI